MSETKKEPEVITSRIAPRRIETQQLSLPLNLDSVMMHREVERRSESDTSLKMFTPRVGTHIYRAPEILRRG